ncbi:unnamed protein product [Staurois parvus]|uniref:Uncharacterized protein n=1 Tax=Staurois parvus TaxID=386267 RepID=A0ABN9C1G0_9NEOB|nr:unnamed protein product [Staurois parvus]
MISAVLLCDSCRLLAVISTRCDSVVKVQLITSNCIYSVICCVIGHN